MFLDSFKLSQTDKNEQKDKSKYKFCVENFITELFTSKNSSPIKRNYGSDFIENVGDLFNIYKLNYYLDNEKDLREKHSILEAKITEISQNGELLNLEMELIIESDKKFKIFIETNWNYSRYTSKDIVE